MDLLFFGLVWFIILKRVSFFVCFVKFIFFDLIFRIVEHKNAKYKAKNENEFHLYVAFPFMLMFYHETRCIFLALAFSL